ncbi:MAG: sigma-70 family RNA polymerase sigma factor [Ruminococcaceae bacterium]|nr:sigma-70 family RNA polymerase sigma factor [Oscillospiraceae bacterium]
MIFVMGVYGVENEVNTLVARVKNGDDAAFGVLCEMYSALTESMVKRFAPSLGIKNGIPQNEAAADPDEMKQDVVMALYKAARTYDADGVGKNVSFGLYAKICMNNAMITKVRKYKSTLRKLEKNAGMISVEKQHKRFEADSVWQGLDLADLSDSLKNAVKELSEYERKVFDLYIDGKSTGEIASELNRTEKSVSNACYRVKTKIKGLLKK